MEFDTNKLWLSLIKISRPDDCLKQCFGDTQAHSECLECKLLSK